MNYKKYIDQLLKTSDEHCVSIYIDTNVVGDYEANRIKWKNAITDAKQLLVSAGVEKTSFLNPAFDLIDNDEYWANRSSGLAGFYSKNMQLTIDLLSNPIPKTIVADRFHISPLLKDANQDERFYVLCLSKNQVRLFEASSSSIIPIIIRDKIPTNFEEALNLDIYKVALQSRTSGDSSNFHNSNAYTDKENIRLEQFLRAVDNGVNEIIEYEGEELVIACVEEYYPVYKDITKYPKLSNHMLTGNFDNVYAAEIWNQLHPIFKDFKEIKLNSFTNEFNLNKHQNKTAEGFIDILKYGKNHQIKSILVNPNVLISDDNLNIKHEEIDDLLLDLYTENVDIIFSKELNTKEPIQAILRYA